MCAAWMNCNASSCHTGRPLVVPYPASENIRIDALLRTLSRPQGPCPPLGLESLMLSLCQHPVTTEPLDSKQ